MAYEDKSAQAVCTFAYCRGPTHDPVIFEGRITVSFDTYGSQAELNDGRAR